MRLASLIFLVSCVFLAGCSLRFLKVLVPGDKGFAMKMTPKIDYAYDLSTPESQTARIIIEAEPPGRQFSVYTYGIELDDVYVADVSKYSRTELIVDAGPHKLRLYANASTLQGIYGKKFGKPSVLNFDATKDEWVFIKYEGPFSMLEAGIAKRSLYDE